MAESRAKNEQVYQALKSDILNGAYSPDFHLDKEALRKKYGFSTTPTNIALVRLFNEGLLEKRGRDGFYTRKMIQLTELREIYLSTASILKLAAAEFYANSPKIPLKFNLPTDLDIVSRTELVFETIAGLLGHFTFYSITKANNDRLHFIRLKKAPLLPGREEELSNLIAAFEARDLKVWSTLLDRYVGRRLDMLTQLTRLTDQVSGIL